MPTISVNRDILFNYIGQKFSKLSNFICLKFEIFTKNFNIFLADKEFDELCFEFGIELDDVVVEKVVKTEDNKSGPDEETIYKIEIPANRYDLLCVEGLGRSLSIFLKK